MSHSAKPPYSILYPSTKLKTFWDELAQSRFVTTRCRQCSELHWPPRTFCPHCRSSNLEWTRLRGTGKLYTYTEVVAAAQGFEDLAPYLLALVELDEGPVITGRVIGTKREELAIGMPMQIAFVEAFGVPSYAFTKVEHD